MLKHEGPVGKVGERCLVQASRTGARVDALDVELGVDRVGAVPAGMQTQPERYESVVVLPPAQGARPVAGGERSCLVEEEELREAAGLHQRLAVPAAELEPARDPALPVEAAPDPSRGVVEAAAVTVDEPAGGIGDELPERRHTVL